MIHSLRNIKLRIKSIESTQKIMRAMQMVSATKLNRVKNVYHPLQNYFMRLESFMKDVLSATEAPQHPFLEKREGVKNIGLCIITSDAGLCGAYNHTVIRSAENFMEQCGRDRVTLVTVGKEGFTYFKKHGFEIKNAYLGLRGKYSSEVSEEIAGKLADMFLRKDADEIYIAYTHFIGTLKNKPIVEKFLNIEQAKKSEKVYLVEPGIDTLLDRLLRHYISEKLHLIFLDAFVAEHAARMIAMKTATDNAKEMIESLTLLKNEVRQADITKEMIEIALSAEALKG